MTMRFLRSNPMMSRPAGPDREGGGGLAFPALALVLAFGSGGCVSTPLIEAAARGDNESVRTLVEAGADINPTACKTVFSCTSPLIVAAQNGQIETVRLLLAAGAYPYAIDGHSKSALDYAEENGYANIARVLKDAEEIGRAQEAGGAVSLDEIKGIVQAALDGREGLSSRPVGSDVDKPRYQRPERPDDVAIVAGVEKYAGLPDAQFAERDAAAMREHLAALGFPKSNIVYAANQQVTKTGLMKYLEAWLPRKANERSTVFFYFSGHGAPEIKTGRAYLVPADGDPKYLRLSGYPLGRLYDQLAALKARRIVVALDSCFSGAGGRSVLPKGARPLVTRVDLGMVADGRIVSLSASGADEISGTAREEGHGLFTYYLLKGLNGDAEDKAGRVTAGSLYDYLKPKVQDAARRENREQTPRIFPEDAGRALELR